MRRWTDLFMRRSMRYLLGCWVGCLLVCGQAQAVARLTFDLDYVNPYQSGEPILNYSGVHNGFLFGGASYIIHACGSSWGGGGLSTSGYCGGTISPDNALFGAYAGSFSFSRPDGGLFSIYGLYVTPAWHDNLNTTITGYRNGVPIYTLSKVLPSPFQTSYTNLNFIAIDNINVASSGGYKDYRVPFDGTHVAFDNIEYSISVCPTQLTHYNNTSPVALGSEIYFTYAELDNCWGRATSTGLDSKTGAYAPTSTWDASCTLTGTPGTVACQRSGVAPLVVMNPDAPATGINPRQLMVNDNALGLVPFRLGSFGTTLNPQEQALLTYLRGNRSGETSGLRVRSSVLGDIINATPVAVGAPSQNYGHVLQDALTGRDFSAQATGYKQFQSDQARRPGVLYVGANDGFLHAFRAGLAQGNVTQSPADIPNDGAELLGYMPRTVWTNLRNNRNSIYVTLDYANPNYAHQFYLDAPPAAGDVYYGGNWHTLLATGLGPGGPVDPAQLTAGEWIATRETETAYGTLSILDVTNPQNFQENSTSVLFQEWSIQNPPTTYDESQNNTVQAAMPNMGAIYGTPLIQRLHNGDFGVIFGNGLYSQNGNAGIFVARIDQVTGATTLHYLQGGPSTIANQKNGIAFVTAGDLDGDGVVDYVYAGDVQGNVWRFDLTATNPLAWGKAVKIFATPNNQPITSSLVVTPVKDTNGTRVMVEFGTGRVWPLEAPDGPLYVTGSQSLYGIWDWNMNAWNAHSSATVAALPNLPGGSALLAQTLGAVQTINGVNYRSSSSNPVCWVGGANITGCGTYNNFGWKLDLPAPSLQNNEQVVSNPVIFNGQFVVNTIVPLLNDGYTMVLGLATGAPPPVGFFADAGKAPNIAGVNGKGLGTPLFLTLAGGQVTHMYFKDVSQTARVIGIGSPHTTPVVKRLTFRVLR